MPQNNAEVSAHIGRIRKNTRAMIAERQTNLIYYAAWSCVLFLNLMQSMGISIRGLALGRPITMLGLGCTALLFNDKEVFKRLRKNPCTDIILFYLVFAGLMFTSSFICRHMVPVYNPVTKNLFFQLMLVQEIALCLYSIAMKKTQMAAEYLFYVTGGVMVLTDVLMFAGIHFTDGQFETYLVGTKFDIVYLHMLFMALYFMRLKYSHRKLKSGKAEKNSTKAKTEDETIPIPVSLMVTFFGIIVVISQRVDCNTGMLGGSLMVMMIYCSDRFPRTFGEKMGRPKVFIIALFASVTFAYYVTWILNNAFVQYIVVDQLGRSLTLTGRTMIFAMYPGAMTDHWIWGWGYGNDYPVCWELFHFADAQNALLQWILEVGIPATAAMCAIFCVCVNAFNNTAAKNKIMPLLVLEYIYILLGTVEITINNNFWLWMLFIYMLSYAEPAQINDQEVTPTVRVKRDKNVRRFKQERRHIL